MQTLTDLTSLDAGESRPLIVFAHANGYPPESYRMLLAPLAKKFRVLTVEHRPFWSEGRAPRTLDWQVYADDLLATLKREVDEPVFLVGHSMGATIGMLAALRAPSVFRGLVALDPVLLPLKYWMVGQVMRVFGKDLPMIRSALRRPHSFKSYQAAHDFYRSKRPFRKVSDEVLADYVRAGHAEMEDGSVDLRWSGAWEACVYRSAPMMYRRLRRLKLPALAVVGRDSAVFGAESLNIWHQMGGSKGVHEVDGGHLIPLENPEICADYVTDFIQQACK
ncbi:alpha/beta hydrolase [Luminiphilus sp.]|nr:alpha/beta hydrolase [Luminiphilus sp.]